MKALQKSMLIAAALGFLCVSGCKPVDLSMQRNRIFVMGRLLAGKTCDVRVIWRNAPGAVAPASVTADLTEIGGGAEEALAPDDNNTALWRWSGQVTPDTAGERLITITAAGYADNTTVESKRFRVFNTDRTIAIASCMDHYLALKANGTVAEAFIISSPYWYEFPVADAVAIAGYGDGGPGGYSYSTALRADGTVAIWGRYYHPAVSPLKDSVAIAARDGRVTALKADGTVVDADCEGGYRTYAVPEGLADVVAIASGYAHTLALKADGTVVAWGYDGKGECDVPTSLHGVAAIAGGWQQSLALKDNGEVIAWGLQQTVPVRIGRDFTAIASGLYCNAGLRKDGTVVAWWFDLLKVYYVISGLPGTIAITHSLALAEDGSVTGFTAEWDGISTWPVPQKLQ